MLVQWLRFHAPNAEGLGLILVRELNPTRHNKRVHTPQLKMLHTTTKIEDPVYNNSDPVQPSKYFLIFKK